MGNTKKFVVTRDSVEIGKDASIVVWEEGAEPKLNEESLWDDNRAAAYVSEYTVEDFEEEYSLKPPGLGSKRTMLVSYAWEEDSK